jgi:putative transposase
LSTRRQQLGIERISKSQVLRLAKSLDQIVEDFRTRPLDGAPYPYLTLDALVVKCREGGRTVNVCVVRAVAVNRDGFRESLGLDVVSEDGAARLAFMRGLVARGLAGVKLASSDAHPGLVDAIAATLPGAAALPHHFMRNLLTRVPKSAQSFVAAMVCTIFAQPDAEMVHEQPGPQWGIASELSRGCCSELMARQRKPSRSAAPVAGHVARLLVIPRV